MGRNGGLTEAATRMDRENPTLGVKLDTKDHGTCPIRATPQSRKGTGGCQGPRERMEVFSGCGFLSGK